VKEYWIVDPKKEWVEIFQNKGNKFEMIQRAESGGIVKSFVLNKFEISLADIFSTE